MEKNYYKINFTRLKNGEKTYGFVRAWSAETAKQLIVQEMQGNIEITNCVQVTKEEYKKAMGL